MPRPGFVKTEGKNVKGKVHHRKGQKGPQGEERYSSNLSLTSSLNRVRGQRHAPAVLYPRERHGTHCTGSGVGPRAGLVVQNQRYKHEGLVVDLKGLPSSFPRGAGEGDQAKKKCTSTDPHARKATK